MEVPDKGSILHKPLKEISAPAGAIIGLIVRDDQTIIPSGDDHLEPADHLVLFALSQAIPRLERFFS
jgi:trk system potassium uptake protein TrkA